MIVNIYDLFDRIRTPANDGTRRHARGNHFLDPSPAEFRKALTERYPRQLLLHITLLGADLETSAKRQSPVQFHRPGPRGKRAFGLETVG